MFTMLSFRGWFRLSIVCVLAPGTQCMMQRREHGRMFSLCDVELCLVCGCMYCWCYLCFLFYMVVSTSGARDVEKTPNAHKSLPILYSLHTHMHACKHAHIDTQTRRCIDT